MLGGYLRLDALGDGPELRLRAARRRHERGLPLRPVLSRALLLRLIFQTHARYVIYATEQHLNSPRFLAQDEDEEDDLVAQRHNIPKHLLGQFLDGLEVDVQAKLGESARALATLGQAPKDAAELAALRAQVASLENTLRDLREASLRRQQTAAAAPKRALRRATTALERRDTGVESRRRPKPEGSAKGFYDRVLQRRATRAEEAAAAADNAAATAASWTAWCSSPPRWPRSWTACRACTARPARPASRAPTRPAPPPPLTR